MKTITQITEGFKNCDVQSLQLSKLKYFFVTYNNIDMGKNFNYVGYITRFEGGYEMGRKWYKCKDKFIKAIKRHLKKQVS